MKIYTSPYPTVPVAEESVYTYLAGTRFADFPPEHPAFIDAATGRTITRGEWRTLTLSLAWGLRHELHRLGGPVLKRGDVAMIFSPNSIAWPIMLFGGMAAGLSMTLANSAYTPRELEHQWTDSGASVVFTHATLVPVVLEMFKHLGLDPASVRRRIIVVDWLAEGSIPSGYIGMADLLGKGQLKEEEKFPGELSNETALICYSSGTTGNPKGVMTTHRNVTTVLAMHDVGFPNMGEKDPVMLGILPFFHSYGTIVLLHFPYIRGMPVVIMQRFDPVASCRWIEKYHCTQMLVAPPICVVFSQHPALEKYNLTSLKLMMCGAAPLRAPLMIALRKRFKSLGADVAIVQGYGLTETSPTAHILPAKDVDRKVGSVGVLLPNLEARLVLEDVEDAAEGEPGELWLRGPTVMKGYLNNPEATANSITPDGWFKTGDIAVRDEEGYYSIVDRRKELIKYKGFQVPPAELESVLLQHPDIADVGVVGVQSDAEATELPRAYVVRKPGVQGDDIKAWTDSVHAWIKERVARHKYLRGGIIIIDAIPKSAAGKILRRQLRDLANKEAAPTKAKL